VKHISIFVLGFATASASVPALAQDLTAGKTPAQLFRSDCAECHRSPNGLARNRDVRTLADFLREHYTTKSETAGALAAYVSGFAAAARNRGTGAVVPAAGERRPAERRSRSEDDATENGEDARTNVGPVEDPVGRQRRATRLSSDNERRKVRNDGGDVPRPPGRIVTAPASSRSNARPRDSAPPGAADPRLRSYFSSGLAAESAIAEAAKAGAPKARKRRNHADDVELSAHEVQTSPKPTDAQPTAPPSPGMDAAAPSVPAPQGDVSAAPPVPPTETAPRLEQN
jgi:hypothetical protein